MLGSLGLPEILFILVLALLVFGPKRLPKVGRSLGHALGEFRRATTDLKRSFDREISMDLDDEPATRRPPLSAVEPPPPIEPGDEVGEPPDEPVARTELTVED